LSESAAPALNPAQLEAVRYLDGPCLIVAGAGSGKTRVITAKLLHLISAGIAPSAIAAITFTNKAALEMQERFDASRLRRATDRAPDHPAAGRPTICTFHSLGVRMLRASGRAVGLKPSFSILDSSDCESLMAQIIGTTDRKLVRATLAQISAWKSATVDPSDADRAAAGGGGSFRAQAARAFRDYQATLDGYQSVDFDDLIRLPLALMRLDGDEAALWRSRLRYVLIDEYQDTNAAQYALLKELVRGRGAFTAVGDDDQSIYGWRGATLDNLRRLGEDFARLKVIKLEQNYRSSRTILSAANALIAHNPKLHEKKLWSALGVGDPIRVIACNDDEDEAESVVMRLSAARHQKRAPWSDFAVLYRSNQQARVVEQMLRKERIPYQLSGGQSFFDRVEIRDLCGYLRLLANDDDDPAFVRAVTTPRRGIGPQTLKALADYAGERHCSLFGAVFESGVETRLPERQLAPLRDFGRFINRIRWRAEREPAGVVLDDLIAAIDYQAHLRDSDDPRVADTKWQNVRDFRDWIAGVGDKEQQTLAEMAQRIALITMLGQRERDSDAVRLSTIHAAKGLEFAHVFLIGAEQGLLPHAGRIEAETDQDEQTSPRDDPAVRLAEERRLMYVAITRARRSLAISWCRQRRRARAIVDREPSPFIAEMGLEPDAGPSAVVDQASAKEKLAALRAMLARP
jgi:ATP-dependent DNA helicase Rep